MIRSKGTTIQPEKADAILSGISVVTEDIATQNVLIQELMEDGFDNILKDNSNEFEIYERTKLFSMKYLESEFIKQGQTIAETKEQIAVVEEKVKNLEKENNINLQKGNIFEAKSEKLEQKILEIAKKDTRFKYVLQWWIIPLLLILFSIAFFCFIALQFIFCNNKWNFVSTVNKYISAKTIIGKTGGYNLWALDGVFFSF